MDLSDKSRHLPWIVYGAIDWLDTYLRGDMTVLEWGSGGSTLFFCKRVREVVSIEHDHVWYEDVSRALQDSDLRNCTYHLIEPRRCLAMRYAPYCTWSYSSRTFERYRAYSFREYVRKCLDYPDEHFDFVFVDGRSRASCLRYAIRKLKTGGVLMLDNSERAQYRNATRRLNQLTRKDFCGAGPFLDEPWQTSIWFKGPEAATGRGADTFAHDYDLNMLETVQVSKFGFPLYVTPRFRERFRAGPYEALTSLLIRQSARGAGTFIDVGAHYGFFAVLAGLANPDCRVLAFEPLPENVEILRRNLSLNGISAEVHAAAVSNVSGRAEFQVSEASDSSGFVANPAAGEARRMQTDVVRLDDLFDRIGVGPVLVKIDVEGNEIRVLEGMERIIREREDVRLVLEFNPRCLESNGTTPEALLDRLDVLGFDVHFVLDSERQYARYRDVADWRGFMQGKTSTNLYCTKKSGSLSLCVFSHSAALDGAEQSLVELVDSMTRRYGTLFTVVLPSDGPLRQKIEDLGAATLIAGFHWWCALPTMPPPRDADALMQSSLQSVYDALPSLWRLSPDALLTNTITLPWGSVAAMKMSRPHVWWIKEFGELDHGLEFYLGLRQTLEIICESSNHIVVNSQAVKEALFADVPAEKCSVATNCVSLKRQGDDDTQYFRRPDSLKLAMAGRVERPKGQDDAVRALGSLLGQGHEVELCIAGTMVADSAFSRELQELIAVEGVGDRVRLVGFLDNVRPLLEQADVVLTCSRNEAFGRTTTEAMMLGKPVIGTDSGGTPELIDDGVTGFLYPPGDYERLAERIASFARCPQEIQAFGRRACRAILTKLAQMPVDSRLYKLCLECKTNARNSYSPQLTRLLLGWQRELGRERYGDNTGLILLPDEAAGLRTQLDALHASTSWRATAPLRRLSDLAKRLGASRGDRERPEP